MKLWKRIVFFVGGILILTLGISMTIKANIGTGAWDALNVGLSKKVGFTIGNWVFLSGVFIMFINAYLLREKPRVLSLGTIFVIGMFVDFWMILVLKDWAPVTPIWKLSTLLSGIAVISVGVAIYLLPKFPPSPMDIFMLAIHQRFKVNLMAAKTIGELFGLILAFLIGGPIGVGTLIITFLIGPLVQLFFPIAERWLGGART
ncbi:YczE/YyaS/YitT family protein [Peribacillus alkalitolerans]|uniref:YczE/YyaS/YitT family protein n=1 Tax=Peribacillus alkalitolerans TaxID=1550385 RepID=UPI001F07A457|nr:YitT family protein [Peribacillus alkalitolerans]